MSVTPLESTTSLSPVSRDRPVSAAAGEQQARGREAGTAPELSEDEQREVQELKQRDREVKAHEMAHVAAGGQYVRGGASFEYQTGPDGKRYATGGEVSIDTTPVKGDPEQTIRKMQTVRKAALAPAQPSAQDRSVAAKATQHENKARQELAKQRGGTQESPGGPVGDDAGTAKTGGYTRKALAVAHPTHASVGLGAIDLIA